MGWARQPWPTVFGQNSLPGMLPDNGWRIAHASRMVQLRINICDTVSTGMLDSEYWHVTRWIQSSDTVSTDMWHGDYRHVTRWLQTCDTVSTDMWRGEYRNVRRWIPTCDTVNADIWHNECFLFVCFHTRSPGAGIIDSQGESRGLCILPSLPS